MTQLKMVTILLTYTIQGNSLPVEDSLLDLWQPHNHIASTTLLSFQHPLNFELESQYQLISSKQADMLITTPRFFKIPYYKIKLRLVRVTERWMWVQKNKCIQDQTSTKFSFIIPGVGISAKVEFTFLLMWSYSSFIKLYALKSGCRWRGCI